MNLIGILACLIWAVVGFVFWIPLLARAIAIYIAAVTGHAIASQKTKGLAKILPDAITFYARGFRRIRDSFDDDDTNDPREPLQLNRIAFEVFWSFSFWFMAGFSVFSAFRALFPERHYLTEIRNEATSVNVKYSVAYSENDWQGPLTIEAGKSNQWEMLAPAARIRFDSSVEEGFQEQTELILAHKVVGRPIANTDWQSASKYTFVMTDNRTLELKHNP